MPPPRSPLHLMIATTFLASVPLGCGGEDSDGDVASTGDEAFAGSSGASGDQRSAVEPSQAHQPAAGPSEPPAAEPPAAEPTAAAEPAPMASSGDAGTPCDYSDEPPDPYPGCLRG